MAIEPLGSITIRVAKNGICVCVIYINIHQIS